MMTPGVVGEGCLSFQNYDNCPVMTPVDSGQDIVMVIVGTLVGGVFFSSVDGLILGKWFLE